MRDKRGNFGLISGVLLPSFTLNYMIIRVKERGFEKENRKNKKRERESNEKGETKLWENSCLIQLFGGGRLWFSCFHK